MRLSRNRLVSRAPARRSLRRAVVLVAGGPGPQAVVLGYGPRDAVFGQVVLQVADAAEQLADLAALGGDLAVRALELALGVSARSRQGLGPVAGVIGSPARASASLACPAAAAVTSARASAFW